MEVYHQIMRQLTCWVKRPTQEEMITIVEGHLYSEQLGLKIKRREVEGALYRHLAQSRAQETVLSRSPEYLGVEILRPHWVK